MIPLVLLLMLMLVLMMLVVVVALRNSRVAARPATPLRFWDWFFAVALAPSSLPIKRRALASPPHKLTVAHSEERQGQGQTRDEWQATPAA
jgi:hypothetical protein